MSDADKVAIQKAKASTWKKILIWSVVVLVFCTIFAILLIVVLKKKNPVAASKAVLDYAKTQSAKADLDAKIEVAKARAVEEAVIEALQRIRGLDNEEERAKRLAELL